MSRYYVDIESKYMLNESYLSVYTPIITGFCSYHSFFKIKILNKDEVFEKGEEVSIIKKRFLLLFKRRYVVKYDRRRLFKN